MDQPVSLQERFKRGSADAWRYFNYMANFIGFSEQDREAIKETRFILEKHIPAIVGRFYSQLLRYPATRQFFLKKDGSVDQEYLQLRMHHQVNFWRRTASVDFNEDYARFIDYVGRAHTSQGADPKIYIPARYVIGMVGFVQHELLAALHDELRELDPELEARAAKAWSSLMMVLLEMLSRAYGQEHESEGYIVPQQINDQAVMDLSVEMYERALGMARSIQHTTVIVGPVDEIPEGQRKIIQVDELSIGVFHHKGQWYALHNSCLHRGGPVCAGNLDGDTLTCPWHGYQYNLADGKLLLDRSATLPMYPVTIVDGMIRIDVPRLLRDPLDFSMAFGESQPPPPTQVLAENQFLATGLKPGQARLVHLDGQRIAVYNVNGEFYATQDECTHADGPLSQGELEGTQIICPWHASCFDVRDGSVQCGPADTLLKTYRVVIEGGIGSVQI
jgi:nitrite reductase/ring-hydroxylating ferredoxin subunit/hemoglobin-like flavoprotein